ncbi:MAG: PEP-CTERM sorting domain-containing protein [Opitutales bacterium]|nr:PEP-CTERM sorting domain-containing protein [Opitutales bacterium]
MKKTCIISAFILGAFAFSAYAQSVWEYDSENPENNTKDNWSPTDEWYVDASQGSLTASGHFENKGVIHIVGSNYIDGNGNGVKGSTSFIANSGNNHNRNTLILENVDFKTGNFYNENSNHYPTVEIKGYVTNNSNFYTKQTGIFLIDDGAMFAGHTFIIENSAGVVKLANARAKTFVADWEFRTQSESVIDFTFTNDTLECVDASSAAFRTRFAKSLNGKIEIDLTNMVLTDDFVLGETYKIALVNSWSGEHNSGQFDDTWQVLSENVANGQYAEFAGFEKTDTMLYVSIKAIPEPSTCAAIFGALALAFAVCRRRK